MFASWGIYKVIHKMFIVTIEDINICLPITIIKVVIKANFPGDHPFSWRGMLTRQPACCTSTTVVLINRSINDFCAGLTHDAIPTIALPIRSDIGIITCLITTIVITAKVMFSDHVVS